MREQALLDLLVERDVGAPEAVDRLLRIADQEQLARAPAPRARQSRCAGIVGDEQHQDLGLQRVGVLELVDEEVREAAREVGAHRGVAHESSRVHTSRSTKSSTPAARLCSS